MSQSYFPVLIQDVKTSELFIANEPEDIQSGRAFQVLETNYKYDGSKCPACKADISQVGSPEITGVDTIARDCSCGSCHSYWTEIYTLNGFDNFDSD